MTMVIRSFLSEHGFGFLPPPAVNNDHPLTTQLIVILLRWSSRDLTDFFGVKVRDLTDFFGVKVKTVKLRRAALYDCPNDTDDGIHSDHSYL